ncbi:MAG TPA: histidine kinase [Streptosporangiaceae bacterium]|nr:histidine kinase [Streptosporangiaceae bacterium]
MDELRLPFTERLPVRWRLFLDVLVAVLLAAASAAQLAASHPAPPAAPGWTAVRYLAVVAACGALPFRRRFAAPVLGVVAVAVALLTGLGGPGGDLITGGGGLAVLALPLAVYGVAAASPRPRTAAGIGAAVAAIEAGALFAAAGPDWGAVLPVLALAAAGWLAGENTRSRRAHLQGVLERAAEREREREQRARQAGAEERLRIARELHDVVAHAMSIIAVRSGVARMVLDVRPDEAREALGIIEGTSRQALAELRLLVGVLRGNEPQDEDTNREPAPGLADMPGLIGRINQAGVPVGLRVEGELRRLSPGVDLCAYRIVQEALTNVVRHAAPATAELTVRYQPDEVVIEVTDDGCARGTRPAGRVQDGTGQGIAGMRERATVYGGKLVAEPTASGFRVLARIPTGQVLS